MATTAGLTTIKQLKGEKCRPRATVWHTLNPCRAAQQCAAGWRVLLKKERFRNLWQL